LPQDDAECEQVRREVVRQESRLGAIGVLPPVAFGIGAKKLHAVGTVAVAAQKFKAVRNKNN